jgi:hypothetical protein
MKFVGRNAKYKINPFVTEIRNYRYKRYNVLSELTDTDRQTDRLPHIIIKYQPLGNEAKDEPSEDFLTANGTGTGREA